MKKGFTSGSDLRKFVCALHSRQFIALVLTGLIGSLPISSNSLDEAPLAEFYFGISLATGPHSQLYSCFLVKEFEGEVIQSDGITMKQFILQASGQVPSKANPDRTNFFEQFHVGNCVSWVDSVQNLTHFRCDPLSELWKLRFSTYPFAKHEGMGNGWAEHESRPSERQMLLLSKYGIDHLTDLCYGVDAFKLLRDVNDPEWVSNYSSGY